MDSILNSVKKMIGFSEDYDVFDPDLIMHINSAFSVLTQLGVGPKNGFSISGADETWSLYFAGQEPIEMVKSYMYLKVRLLFDPPNVGVLHEAMERQVQEFEWRLNVAADDWTWLEEEVDDILEGDDDYE